MPDPTPAAPSFALETLLPALGDYTRWKILQQLSRGEPLMVTELAAAVGHSPDNTSKHLRTLREAGAVLRGRGNLYQVPPACLASPGVIDYGSVVLRFPGAGA